MPSTQWCGDGTRSERAQPPLHKAAQAAAGSNVLQRTWPEPDWRSRWDHIRVRRGSWYSLCASSTCAGGTGRAAGQGEQACWPHGPKRLVTCRPR